MVFGNKKIFEKYIFREIFLDFCLLFVLACIKISFLCQFIDSKLGENIMIERPTLYKKERSTLEFIKKYMFEHQTAPSLEEIRKHFGKKSLATVHKRLGQLETKGYIERNKHHGRSITLTELALEYFNLKPLKSI